MNVPRLTELDGKLEDRRKKLAQIFAEAGPNIDFNAVKCVDGDSAAVRDAVKALNDEMTDISKERDDLIVTKAIAERVTSMKSPDAEGDDGDDGSEPGGDEIRKGRRNRKTLAEQFAAAKAGLPSLKQFRQEFDVDVKTLMTTAAGWAPDIVRGPRMVDLATAPISVLDFIPFVTTNQTSVSFMEETTRTNAAAERAEGGAKVESTLVLTEQTSPVRSIATSMGVTDEQLEDVDRIDAYLNTRLPMFLRERLELQVLVGDGTAPNISGILDNVGIQTQAKGADPTPDAVYKAMVKVMTVGDAMPDAVVFNPLDWQDVRLLRTVDGIYIWGSPADAGPERIWGLPVLLSQRLTQNTAIVGAFKAYTEVAVKKGITIERGYINDDFTKDITRLRAEMRAAFILYRPAAMCSVTGV